jgi:hypothetical protein
MAKNASPKATLPAVGDSPTRRRSTRAAASASTSPAPASAAAVAAPIALASAVPPSLSDSDKATAALLAKPKPGGTGKKSAKGRAPDGAGNTLPAAKEARMNPSAKNATTIAAAAAAPSIADVYDAIFPSSDSDEAAAVLLAKPKPGDQGRSQPRARLMALGTLCCPPRMQIQLQQWCRPPHCLILINLLRHWLNQQSLAAQERSHPSARGMMLRTPPQCRQRSPPRQRKQRQQPRWYVP